MNSATNGVDTSVAGVSWAGFEMEPLEAQPPTAAEWASYGVALVWAGLAMLWVALVEVWREALR